MHLPYCVPKYTLAYTFGRKVGCILSLTTPIVRKNIFYILQRLTVTYVTKLLNENRYQPKKVLSVTCSEERGYFFSPKL